MKWVENAMAVKKCSTFVFLFRIVNIQLLYNEANNGLVG